MKTTCTLFVYLVLFGLTACNNVDKTSASLKKVDNKGVNIAYTKSGKGDTTLLFVHGWCINKTYWENQIPYFSKHYRVIAIDLPGFGKAGKNREEFNTAIYAEDVNAVIDQLGLKNVILIGHSMAGDIVLQAASNNKKKVIGIIGIDNFKSVGINAANKQQAKKDYEDAIAALKKDFKSVALPYFNQQLFYKTTSSAIRKRILYDVTHADTVVAVKAISQNDFAEADKLKELNKTLYLLNSDYDSTNVAGLKQLRLPYRLTYIHATGHFPMVEKPQEFNTLLEGIIKKM